MRRRRRHRLSQIVSIAGVAAAVGLAIAFAVASLNLPRFYLNSDIGHYLADADSLFGHGVREARHPPLVPLLIGATRVFVHDDLVSVRVVAALVLAALGGSFYFFVRGRTGSMLGDFGAAALFVLAPTMAEAIGWFGIGPLLGLAFGLVLLRIVSDLVAEPSVWRAVVGALAAAAVVLTHPFAASFAAESVAVYLGMRSLAGIARIRSPRSLFKANLRLMLLLSVVASGGLLALALSFRFYTYVRSPFTLTVAPQNLDLIWTWAFRENAIVWVALLALSLVAVPLGRRVAGQLGLELGLAVAAIDVVVLANVLLLQGDPSYVTRNLYVLPVSIAATLGIILSSAVNVASRSGRYARPLLHSASWALLIVVGASAFQAYSTRLEVAVPYYNQVNEQELAAIRFLSGTSGTVIVTPKGSDLQAGTQYAWMIEGLARERALGSGLAAFSLADIADRETADAERFIAGPATLEDDRIRAAFDGTTRMRVKVSVNVAGTWLPLLDIDPVASDLVASPALVSATTEPSGGKISSSLSGIDQPATMRLDSADHLLQVALPANQLALDHQVTVIPRTTSGRFTATGSGVAWAGTLGGERVAYTIDASDDTGRIASLGIASGQAKIEVSQGRSLAIRLGVAGSTARPSAVVVYTQAQLIRNQSIHYMWTWRSTGMLEELAARPCFTLAFENDDVAIFRVAEGCDA